MATRIYDYVGPEHVRTSARGSAPGTVIRSPEDLVHWCQAHRAERENDLLPATFVVRRDGYLYLASRRSEHVACASGDAVLGAGEIFFSSDDTPRVVAVSNLSTGYCPEPECWPAIRDALEGAGIPHPREFSSAFIFRRCPNCFERNLIKDDVFVCDICDTALPRTWNFA
ncbi:hypothetical protein LVJ94_41555 [Pendulispora rubella]|uniref:Uncharacterized protein n=1 Tax=Pendulispora rubella TaxID=2741070 RepID=A0ABZ2KXG0_9BACT